MPKTPNSKGQDALARDLAPETIGFRLTAEDRKLLHQHALQAGISAHALARVFVENVLKSGGELGGMLALLDEAKEIRRTLELIRKDLSLATAVLLVSAGRTTSEAAKAWVEANLRLN